MQSQHLSENLSIRHLRTSHKMTSDTSNDSIAMNHRDLNHPTEPCVQHMLEKTEEYVRSDPTRAVFVAFGVGLLLKLLPARVVARPIASVAAKLLPPTLIGLGLLKTFELCCQQNPSHKPAVPQDPSP
jgi:ElaB/YqjD/DUF883 family membrane-anchored ribosome-binding protein